MAGISSAQIFKLKKFVKELEKHRGRHTELVSVYIPQGYDLNKIISHLAQEQGTASNIKSATTRKNVQDALERMIQHLRLFTKTPKNGLAVFSGNISEKEGQSDVQVWSLEPPVPLNQRLYRCDKTFVLEPIQNMCETTEVYGMVVLDRRDAMIALLKGKAIVPLVKTHSEVPGKFKAGGQSAARFGRIREGAANDHYKKVANLMKDQFLPIIQNIKGILIGGPSTTTSDFQTKDYLTGEVKKKIIGIRDLSYTGEFGLQELLEKSQDILAGEEVSAEKKIMGRFFDLMNTKEKQVAYGIDDVKHCLGIGAVEILLISETADDKLIEELEAKAAEMGSEVKIISVETREGVQLRDISGIAAILRYEVER